MPAGDDGAALMGFKGRPVSVCIKGIIPVQFNKAACIITVQFINRREIESLRTGARTVREREGGR